MNLLDVCDEVSIAKHFVGCLYLACQQTQATSERAAWCAVANAARERLETVETTLHEIVAGDQRNRPETP